MLSPHPPGAARNRWRHGMWRDERRFGNANGRPANLRINQHQDRGKTSMNDTFDLRISESHIEVHKYPGGTILLSVILALILQAFLHVYITKASILDLPLLITIYFGLSRRNPSTGLLLGTFIGLLRDSLSKTPIGLFG